MNLEGVGVYCGKERYIGLSLISIVNVCNSYAVVNMKGR